ncbi:7TM GPCR protein [Aphelenchoides avenae]|nr:7TM GPCR protein [Aphelenchus avenae]
MWRALREGDIKESNKLHTSRSSPHCAMSHLLLHRAIVTCIQSIAVVVNTVLLALIWRYSPRKLSHYRWSFTITCVCDLLLAISTLLAEVVIVSTKEATIFVYNGFFSNVLPSSVLFGFVVAYIAMLHMNICFLCVPFLYRYHVICRKYVPCTKLLIKLSLVPLFLSLLGLVGALNVLEDSVEFHQTASQALVRVGWAMHEASRYSYRFIGANAGDYTMWALCGLFAVSITLNYIAIVYCKFNVHRKLTEHGASSNPSIRRMQTDLHYALISLGVCPLVSLVIPVCVIIVAIVSGADVSSAAPWLSVACTTIALANPLTIVYFVRPFRYASLKMLSCQWNSIAQTSPTVSTAFAASSKHRTSFLDVPVNVSIL